MGTVLLGQSFLFLVLSGIAMGATPEAATAEDWDGFPAQALRRLERKRNGGRSDRRLWRRYPP